MLSLTMFVWYNLAGLSPVTLVVTDDNLFLAKENFAHWPLPRIVVLPPKEALLPPYLDVEQKKISDIQRIVSYSVCKMSMYSMLYLS